MNIERFTSFPPSKNAGSEEEKSMWSVSSSEEDQSKNEEEDEWSNDDDIGYIKVPFEGFTFFKLLLIIVRLFKPLYLQ